MRSYVKIVAVSLALAVGASGCILSRAVDRAFIGATVKRPSSPDRLVTGIVLLPFTAVIDLATFPIQAIIVAIVGDNFPFGKDQDLQYTITSSLQGDPRFQQLGQEEQRIAMSELESLIKSGQMRGHAAALGDDGHWVLVPMTDEAKNQALARAGSTPEGLALR
ncbi:MAG: hypothetical protein QM723_09535 [Myxococcaceae bacterium]